MTYPQLSRRTALAALTVGSVSLLSARAGRAQALLHAPAAAPKKALVCVFLRGAADGLNIVVPHADPEYYRLRPTIAVPRPNAPEGALDLDGRFGLHPRLAPLQAAFAARELALVHAVGSPDATRSHFEAQDYMETGAVGLPAVRVGWLARYLGLATEASGSGLRAVALSERVPLSLRGYPDALAARSLEQFRLRLPPPLRPVLATAFAQAYAEGDAPATRAGRQALAVADRLRAMTHGDYLPDNGARYERPAQPFADVARLIKANVGLETAWIDLGGWDTHRQQGASVNGELPKHLDQLGRALAAFRADLGSRLEDVVVVVMSEFGRTVRENGTGGTDHGHGNVMLVLGGEVRGGKVYGQFSGLAAEHLHEGRDLPVTTDYRAVLAEIARGHLGVAEPDTLFPGYAPASKRPLGLFGMD